jgi:pyruvate dehydrogenase E1 component alpha subunit
MASRTKPKGKSSSTTAKPSKNSKNGPSGVIKLEESDAALRDEHLELFRKMFLIREFELACGENYSKGLIRGFLHLYIGQEATGVGAISALRDDDYIVSTYRDHGHAIARGVDINRAMAELFGRSTGLSKGKGGSMHLFDIARGFMGGHAIVAAQLPLAAGLALAQQYEKTGGVTMCFFGDGSTNQGVYHETLNLTAVWKLPILFFLENNGYGMGSAIDRVRAGGNDFYPGMATYGIPAVEVDGMDVLAVKEATDLAVENIRNGGGPQFIEAKTFRFVGHSYADGQKYRGREEVKEWEERDPVATFPAKLIKMGLVSRDQIDEIEAEVTAAVASAVKFAEDSPDPDPAEIFTDVLA